MRRLLLIGLPVTALLGVAGSLYVYVHRGNLLQDAQRQLDRGDIRGAELDLDTFLRGHPGNPEGSYKLGIVDLAEDNAVAAERNLKRARAGGYPAEQVVLPLGDAYLRQHRYDDILNDFDPAQYPQTARPNVLAVRASAYLALNRVDEARAAAAQAVKLSPDSAQPRIVAARIELALGNLAGVKGFVDQVLARDPKNADARLLQADMQMRDGHPEQALATTQALLKENPKRMDVHMAVARALSTLHRDIEASRMVDEVLRSQPQDIGANYLRMVLAVRERDFATADAALSVISPAVEQLPQAYYFVAVTKLGRGQPAQGEEAAAKYVARSPGDATGVKLLAFAELAIHRPDRAMNALKPLLAGGKPDADTLDLLARAQAMTGDLKSAEQNLAQASAMEPGNTEFLNRLAAAKLEQGNMAEGQADLRKSLAEAPDQPAAARALIQTALAGGDFKGARNSVEQLRHAVGDTELVGVLDAQIKTAELDLEGARASYADVLKRFPDSRDATFGLIQAEGRLGDAKAAQLHLNAWMARHPTDHEGLRLQVRAAMAVGDQNAAIAAAETAHAGDPGDAALSETLAQLYLAAKQPQKAVALLERAAAQSPDLQDLRGEALMQAHRPDEARAVFLAASEANPNDLRPRFGLLALRLANHDYDAARGVVQEALHVSPGNPRLLEAAVAIELKDGGIKAALAKADTLRQDPANMPAALTLPGSALTASGDLEGAAQAYVSAYRQAPSNQLALLASAALQRAKHPDDARALLRDWTSQHPEDIAAQQILSSYALGAHDMSGAAVHLERVLALRPNDAVSLNNMAWVQLSGGDLASARASAQRAYFLAPAPETEDTLGWVMVRQGQGAQAVRLLEQAAAAKPEPAILYHYAAALNAVGRKADARAQLDRALANTAAFDERSDAETLKAQIGE